MTISISTPAAGSWRTISAALLTLAVLSGCGGSSSSRPAFDHATGITAVVATVDPGYTAGAVELIALRDGPMQSSGNFHSTISDISVNSYGQHYYLIESRSLDRISKVDITNPGVFEWQHHGYRAADTATPNLYDLVFVNDEKAYLLRYESNTAWIVDPSATSAADFFLGELDLSAYHAGGRHPHMSAGILVGDRLFITLQRLDSNWLPTAASYVAVFDIDTDEEIDTGHNQDGLKGIPLVSRNPAHIAYQPAVGLLVQGTGEWMGWDLSGGIDRINPDNFSVTQILTGDSTFGRIEHLALIDETTAYISAHRLYGQAHVHRIDPHSGALLGEVGAAAGRDIRALAADPLGRLWIGDAGDSTPDDPPGLRVIDPRTDQQVAFVETQLLPVDLAFVTED